MNIAANHKILTRLWAAVYCDFEAVLTKYMGSRGWRYAHFAKVCRELQITLVMHITQARGKTKDEHYYRIADIIFQLCKELWLRAEDAVRGRPKTAIDNAMALKRGLGGFFLLYTMYEKQPIPGRVKIALSLEDMKGVNVFLEAVSVLPFKSEIRFMWEHLMQKEAFHFCIHSEDFRFDATSRNFLNHSRSEIVRLTKRMRDVQDVLSFSSVHDQVENSLASLSLVKNDIAKEMLRTVNSQHLLQHLRHATAFASFVKTMQTESLALAVDKIDTMIDKPVMTLQALTATEAIDRRMMMETRRRMERARRKVLLNVDKDDHKAARPYVREGGIFGRKKETDEGDDKCKRRERGACSGNLWVFINGYDFDKPMGEREPAAGDGDGDSPPMDEDQEE